MLVRSLNYERMDVRVDIMVSSQNDAPNARRKFAGDAFPSFDLGKLGQGFRCGFGLLAKRSGLLSWQ